MNLAYEQSLFGFDLDFLHEPSKNDDCHIVHNKNQTAQKANASGPDTVTPPDTFQLQRKTNAGRSLNYVKKKIIDTDTVVKQYNVRCEQVAHLEKKLLESNDKCREACIERDTVRDDSECLRKECEILRNKTRQQEEQISENQHIKAASESLTRQLEQLIKEYESKIEGYKLEKALTKARIKELEKNVSVLTKYKEETTAYLHTMADLVNSKRAMTHGEKLIVSKYLKQKKKNDAAKEIENITIAIQKGGSDTVVSEGFLSDTEGCASANNEKVLFSPPLPPKIQATQKTELKKDDADGDPDLTCEVISVDTGRGSSLAFSDSDTLYSPEYYLNSPTSVSSDDDHKRKAKGRSIATSPISWSKHLHEQATSSIAIADDTSQKTCGKNAASILNTVDKATSPIRIPAVTNLDGVEPLPINIVITSCENSRHLDSDNVSDSEVEMILKNMKLSGRPITPIPLTPARSQGVISRTDNDNISNCLARSLLEIREALCVLAKDKPEVNIPKLDNLKQYLNSAKKSSMLNNDLETDASHQNMSRVIDSPEPDISFEATSMDDEEECVNSNQQLIKTKTSQRVQFENTRGVEESPQISCTKTKIADKILFENDGDDSQSESVNNQEKNDNGNLQENDHSSRIVNKDIKKRSKAKKLTRLEKLRSNLIPKGKIRMDITPRTLRSKSIKKSITHSIIKNKKANNVISSASLNNKDVYEKAVKVMAELKSQQKTGTRKIKTRRQHISNKDTSGHKEDTLNEKNGVQVTITKQKEVSPDLANDDEHDLKKHVNADSKLNQNDAPQIIEITPRLKSTSPEIDNILSKSRKKYPSISLDKDIVFALKRSEMDEELNTEQRNIVETVGEAKPETPKQLRGKRVRKLETADNKRILRSATRRSIDTEKNNNENKTCDKNKQSSGLTSNKLDSNGSLTPKPSSKSTKPDSSGSLTRKPTRKSMDKPDMSDSLSLKPITESKSKPDTSGRITRKRSLESPSENLVNYNDLDIFNESPSSENVVSYNDLHMFNEPPSSENLVSENDVHVCKDYQTPAKKQRFLQLDTNYILNPQESVLFKIIQTYSVDKMKIHVKKIPDATVAAINTKISESIDEIIKLTPAEAADALKKLVKDLQKWTLEEFMAGLMAYMTDPTRKLELFNKVQLLSAPTMTKQEQVLLYIVSQASWADTIRSVLSKIEYTLLSLNRTPDINVVESMAHFYAVLCRYMGAKTRLRLFLLDAMYCMTYSAFALIKQCIDVWMNVLPLAHIGMAKCPVVISLVYLLHFHKSDDSMKKVQDMRNILKRKYFYNVTEWDEAKILDMFKNAILELKKDDDERKTLRVALILLAKRNGVKWCQKNVIQSMLMPMIMDKNMPEIPKAFCISILGALLKPYPSHMKVNGDIVLNHLMDMLENNPSPMLEEAIYTSLIMLSRHNLDRVIQALLTWRPKQLSPNMARLLKHFAREKPARVWRAILRNVSLVK